MKRAIVMLAALALLLSHGEGVHAGNIAMSFDSYTNYPNNGSFTLGETLHLSQAITVTALGYLDQGTGTSHDVGIYDLSANLLASTTVNTASDTQIGYFRYHTLSSPLSLAAGDYVLAGTNGTDAYTYQSDGMYPDLVTNFSTGPGVSVSDDRYNNGSSLTFPPIVVTDPEFAWFGANFEYTTDVSAVPEPATMTMLGFGIAGLAGYGWRRRKQPVPA